MTDVAAPPPAATASDSPEARAAIVARATARAKASKRRFSNLTRRDQLTLWIIIGVPTAIHVVFVWIPAISTIVLSFTELERHRRRRRHPLRRVPQLLGDLHRLRRRTSRRSFNNGFLLVFLFLVPTALGVLLAYLLDKNIRGRPIYQSIYYTPVVLSLAVVGFIWKSVMYSQRQGLFSTILGRTDPGNQIDWVGDQSHLISIGQYGISKNFVAILIAMAWRHTGYIMVLYLAGLKSRRPGAARSGRDRRLQRLAGLPAGRVPRDETDQRRRRRHHRDRGAARLRHRRSP